MKKLLPLVAILTLGFNSISFAEGDKGKGKNAESSETVSVSLQSYENSKGINLTALNKSKDRVSVFIYDAFGETVFSETITSSPEIRRSYNMSSLPVGSYQVAVVGSNYTVNKTVELR